MRKKISRKYIALSLIVFSIVGFVISIIYMRNTSWYLSSTFQLSDAREVSIDEIIIRTPTTFLSKEKEDIQIFMEEISNLGIPTISLLVKQDEDANDEVSWNGKVIQSGQLYFKNLSGSSHLSSYLEHYDVDPINIFVDPERDYLSEAIALASDYNINIRAWVPIFRDNFARTHLNSSWGLPEEEDAHYFIDATVPEAQDYEEQILLSLVNYNITGIMLDYLRFCDAENYPGEKIAQETLSLFVQRVSQQIENVFKDRNPNFILGGYLFPPSETYWSGQNYTLLNENMDIFSPMLYWEDQNNIGRESYSILTYISEKIDALFNIGIPPSKIQPVLSLTNMYLVNGHYVQLTEEEIVQRTLLIFQYLASRDIKHVSLFYYGDWAERISTLGLLIEYLNDE